MRMLLDSRERAQTFAVHDQRCADTERRQHGRYPALKSHSSCSALGYCELAPNTLELRVNCPETFRSTGLRVVFVAR